MLAHETGHHLGGPPYDPAMPWISWQGQADYWAAKVAMPMVFGTRARQMTFRGAREILALHDQLSALMDGDEPDLSANCRVCIFRAGALNLVMPDCAKREFRESFGRDLSAS